MTPPDGLAAPSAPAPLSAPPRAVESPPSHSPPRGPIAAIKKYTKIVRVSLSERMTYRSDFLLGTILRFLPLITTILLWSAIYEGSGRSELAGFRYREMIAYLLLTHISRMFSSMPGLAGGIARDIREGTLKRYLIQPVDMIGYLLCYRIAHKIAYITMSFLPYLGLFILCRGYFDGFPDALTMAAYRHIAGALVPGRILFRGERGNGGFLVSRGDLITLYCDDPQFLHLGAYASPGPASPALVHNPQSLAVSVHGLLPGRRLPAQGYGLGARDAPAA